MALEKGRQVPEFHAILDESVEEGLLHVLGASGLQMLRNIYPLSEISTDPQKFDAALTSIFKEHGASIIEREIARRMLEKASEAEEVGGRQGRSWLPRLLLAGRSAKRVPKRERQRLLDFIEFASLRNDHSPDIALTLTARDG